MVEVLTNHEFDVKCSDCGEMMEAQWDTLYGTENQGILTVDPCNTCAERQLRAALDDAKEEE